MSCRIAAGTNFVPSGLLRHERAYALPVRVGIGSPWGVGRTTTIQFARNTRAQQVRARARARRPRIPCGPYVYESKAEQRVYTSRENVTCITLRGRLVDGGR